MCEAAAAADDADAAGDDDAVVELAANVAASASPAASVDILFRPTGRSYTSLSLTSLRLSLPLLSFLLEDKSEFQSCNL